MCDITYQFSYYYYDPKNEDEEEHGDKIDFDEDDAIKTYKMQLADRNEVDAIVISTYYLDRLTLKNIKELKMSAIIEDDGVITFDNEIEEFYDSFKNEDLQGIVFKTTNAIDTLELIGKLESIGYCANCNVQNISDLIWYNVDGKVVLYVSIDTKSD